MKFQTQILAKDVITCDDALYSIREQIYSKKEEVKASGITQVIYINFTLLYKSY